jgi:hypothetical protein
MSHRKSVMFSLKRSSYMFVGLVVVVTCVVQGMMTGKAHAFPVGGPLVGRQITMSSSKHITPGNTSVSYRVAFLPASDYNLQGIIVDFCNSASTPIIGDSTCTAPTGFTVGTPTVNFSPGDTGYTNLGNGDGTWTTSSLNSGRTLKLENNGTNGVALDDGNATRYAFTLTTATNPSTLGTFYARIITYTNDTGDIDSYAPGTEGSTQAQDYGGIALSTVERINITAKVQETLTFCVSEADPSPGCAGTSTPDLTLGHGPNEILDDTATDTDVAFMQASTNAQSGLSIRMKNSNACGGLSRNGGTTCDIAARGATAGTIPAGTTAYFGMYVTPGAGVTAVAPYNAGTTDYGMDTTAGVGVTSTYGSQIATSAGPLNNIESTLTYAATATATTPAGLYSADMTIIATGTF